MIGYILFRIALVIFWLIPFWLLYWIADFAYLLLYKIIGYRTKTVRANLNLVFPNLSAEEKKSIERAFYRHLCDITLEGIKGLTISEAEVARRWKILNPQLINDFYERQQSVIFAGAHYSNWEWAPLATPAQTKQHLVVIYKPISNKRIDAYVRKLRGQHRTEMRSIKETKQVFEQRQDKICAFALVADQSPSNLKEAHYLNFMGLENTPFLHGIAKYAQEYNLPIINYHTTRVKRGFYEVVAQVLTDKPLELENEKITQLFAAEVEKDIRNNPPEWLWSHKRFKHLK